MKTKKFVKTLLLNKSTIADLNRSEMNGIAAGADYTHWTYCTCITNISCFAHCESLVPKACPPIETETAC
jgi:hypothetical protein